MATTALHVLAYAALALACGDGHGHDHALHKRLPPSVPLAPPSAPLVWGDINIIHTTDSHGWLLGHQKPSEPEPNYSADFGDFASFVAHMKALADEKGVDLLLVDTGDLHDGTGLSDGFPPGGVDGHESSQLMAQLPYDVLAIGNHELYIYNITLDMHENFAPRFPGRYLSSNVNITLANNTSVPVGERYAKFTTAQGRRVTALGVLFHFTSNDVGTTVQNVPDMVKETWFAEAIEEEPDFFLLTGHMPVNKDQWPVVFNAVRAVHPNTPILVLGGHTHIRDCVQYDGRSMGLESGRYMETVGWMSANFTDSGNMSFTRRYMDSNRVTFEYHSGQSNDTFDTPNGTALTAGLLSLADQFDLSTFYGTAPQDYPYTRVPYPSNSSLLSLLTDQVLPTALAVNNSRAGLPAYIVVQSGGLRFDVFAGAFTKNDELTASPFTNGFVYIANVSLSDAQKVLTTLNGEGDVQRRSLGSGDEEERYEARYHEWVRDMADAHFAKRDAAENLTLGYVTHDSCSGVGDDIPHTAVQSYQSSFPDYAPSPAPAVDDADAPILDFVFTDFIQDDVVAALNAIQSARVFSDADVAYYSPLQLKNVFEVFAELAWN